ncbi:hypothetical protein ABW20_dc0100552 [Dactylellina cionopaga]|nr:hypothetical protein ABW20_dc0100552 [Dactylellina cionopaga]
MSIVSWLVLGVAGIALPEGARIQKRQSSSIPAGENANPIKAAIIGTNGRWIKFFFSTNNGKVYMGTWDALNPYNPYSYEELLPAGSAKTGTPLAATYWDLDTAVGSGVNWADPKKRARLFYCDASGVIQERIYVGGTGWSSGTIGTLGLTTLGSTGMSAVSFYKDDADNIRLYYADSTGVREAGWGAYGVLQWSVLSFTLSSVAGSAPYGSTPISFLNTNTWSVDPSIRGFYGTGSVIKDVAWDVAWSAGNVAQPLTDSSTSPNGGYSLTSFVSKVEAGAPAVNLLWCGDGGAAGSLGVIYRAQYDRTVNTLGTPAALTFLQASHSFVYAIAARGSSPPNSNHLFAWGNATGTPAFWHYVMTGDADSMAGMH